ncbi:MAG: LysM domain-containing protein [bacterium]|nr:LysM domain-containing protein [bacterium]
MKISNVIIGLISLVLIVGLAFAFNSKNNQLSQSQQTVALAKQQIQKKEVQIGHLSQKVSLLSRKLKTAENRPLLSYKVKTGDTLYSLFGGINALKVAKFNHIKDADNLQAGRIIKFPGYIHKIMPGDTLFKLAGKNWKHTAWLNNLGSCPDQVRALPVGFLIKIPNI